MTRRLPGLLTLALLTLAGCGDGRSAPEPLVVIAGPQAFVRFELRDGDGQVLWGLVAEEPVALTRLVYGEVPQGFRQQIPASGGSPRPLLAGEPLTLESTTSRRLFRHQGFADHQQGFKIDDWQMELLDPLEGAALDGAAQPS